MIVAHLPAGYLLSTLLRKHVQWCQGASHRAVVAAGAIGAVAPDLDMLYFHLVDHRQHHHHSYFTHFPSVWLGLLAGSILWKLRARHSVAAVLAIVFALNGLGHMVLDSVVGDVRWLAPLSDRAFSFATVPALYKPWWLNFLLHWSFLLELGLIAGAFAMWRSLKLST